MSQAIGDKATFHPEQYCVHLDKVAAEFSQRFGELDVTAFVLNAFLNIDVEQVAAKFQQVFALPSGVDIEMFDLQNEIELKVRSQDSNFCFVIV